MYPLEGLYYNFSKAKKLTNLERLDVLYQMLDVILKYTSETSVDIWAIYGTLLGVVRDNELICYDEDVDFGIDSRDFNNMVKILQKITKENKQFTYCVLNIPFVCKYTRLFHKPSGLHCDISVYYKNKAKYVRDIPTSEISSEYDSGLSLTTKTITHNGKTYNLNIPSNSEELLTIWYGNDYMKPLYSCNSQCEDCK